MRLSPGLFVSASTAAYTDDRAVASKFSIRKRPIHRFGPGTPSMGVLLWGASPLCLEPIRKPDFVA